MIEFKDISSQKFVFILGFWTKLGICVSGTWLIKATWLFCVFFFFFAFSSRNMEASKSLACRVTGVYIWLSQPLLSCLHKACCWAFLINRMLTAHSGLHPGWKDYVLKCCFIPHICFLDSTACCSLSCSATWACRSISLKLWLLTFWAPRPFLAPNFKQTNKKKKTHKSQSPCVIPVYRHSTACNKTRKNTQELTLQQQVLRDQPQHTPDRNKVYFFLLI